MLAHGGAVDERYFDIAVRTRRIHSNFTYDVYLMTTSIAQNRAGTRSRKGQTEYEGAAVKCGGEHEQCEVELGCGSSEHSLIYGEMQGGARGTVGTGRRAARQECFNRVRW